MLDPKTITREPRRASDSREKPSLPDARGVMS